MNEAEFRHDFNEQLTLNMNQASELTDAEALANWVWDQIKAAYNEGRADEAATIGSPFI